MEDNYDIQQTVTAELGHGERMLWCGKPDPKSMARKGLVIFFFAIPWTAFAVFWMFAAAGFSIPNFDEGWDWFPLFGVPFVLIGFAMMLAPFWMRLKGAHTIYAVTNQRALIITTGKSKTVKSYTNEDIGAIEKKEKPDGSGDITFAKESYQDSKGNTRLNSVSFIGVSNVREVERYLVETFKRD